jgi:hypothetical protein
MPRVSRKVARPASPGRLARQLSDQPGDQLPALRRQSLEAMGDEIDRAEALGLLGVVLHPGCYTSGSEARGSASSPTARRAAARAARGRRWILLEHTAGRARRSAPRSSSSPRSSPGWTATARRRLPRYLPPDRVGLRHLLSGGYASTFTQFGRLVGFDRLKVFHLNDSKKPLGSRVDRHEHIGEGCLGLEPFRRIVNDKRFRELPIDAGDAQGRGPLANRIESRSFRRAEPEHASACFVFNTNDTKDTKVSAPG